jgi:hypothetical protein
MHRDDNKSANKIAQTRYRVLSTMRELVRELAKTLILTRIIQMRLGLGTTVTCVFS